MSRYNGSMAKELKAEIKNWLEAYRVAKSVLGAYCIVDDSEIGLLEDFVKEPNPNKRQIKRIIPVLQKFKNCLSGYTFLYAEAK
jgi:hypothetical protein